MTGAKRVRRTTLICWLCGGVLLGLWLGRRVPFAPGVVVLAIGVGLAMWRRLRAWWLLCCLLGLLGGWWRGASFVPQLAVYGNLFDTRSVISGTASQDSIYDERGQLSFDLGRLRTETGQPLVGKIAVAGRGATMIYTGDKVQVTGELRPARGSRQARMNFAQIVVTERAQHPLYRLRRQFTASLLSVIPEPQASFGLGLLVGQRNTLPESVSEALSTVGLTHIIAVSGYNMTILVMATRSLMGKRSKYQTTVMALLLMAMFLAVTGFSASIVRATIVSVLSLWAWYYGRRVSALVLLLFAAAVTALWSPLYVWSDVGWYLSFLAFAGVLMVAPIMQRRLFGWRQVPLLAVVAIESLAAQVMTMPLILFVFGRMSLIAWLANILIVPLVPYAMLVTAVAGVLGWLAPQLSGFYAWPAQLLLGYMLGVAQWLSQRSFAERELSITFWQLSVIYAVIGFGAWAMYRRNKQKYGTITDIEARQME